MAPPDLHRGARGGVQAGGAGAEGEAVADMAQVVYRSGLFWDLRCLGPKLDHLLALSFHRYSVIEWRRRRRGGSS